MTALAEFHFIRPLWLLALPVAVLLLWSVWRHLPRSDSHLWRDACDPWLLPHLLTRRAHPKRFAWIPVVALFCAIVALAGPSWSKLKQPLQQSFSARVIVLDLSLSMDAGDFEPSRLHQAKIKVERILRASDAHQVSLVVFAGDAFMVTPLSYDVNTVLALLPVLDTSLIPVQGSRPDRALDEAATVLRQTGVASGEIILICDGFKGERVIDSAQRLRARGHFVSVLAAGTAEGAPIPLEDGSFLLTMENRIALPQANLEDLQRIALVGGGRFAVMLPGSNHSDVDSLTTLDLAAASQLEVDRDAAQWIEQGPWLVLLALPFAALAFRRGWLLLIAVTLPLQLHSDNAVAFDWQSFWLRADQKAAAALAEGRTAPLLEHSSDPAWRGSALYRRNDYRAAEAAFGQSDDADAHYNRGNALANLGELEAAVAAYDLALTRRADHADALFNRTLVVSMLRQQEHRNRADFEDDAGTSGPTQQGADAADNPVPRNPAGENPSEQTEDPNRRLALSQQPLPSTELDGEETASAAAGNMPQGEQSLQQWLQQIPDDPGALLRRKFAYKYGKRRSSEPVRMSDAW